MVGMPLVDALKLPGMRELIIEIGEEACASASISAIRSSRSSASPKASSPAPTGPTRNLFDTLAAHSGRAVAATPCCRIC